MKIEQVEEVIDRQRGCGWRKPGGIYLRADGPNMHCGKLPLPLEKCPCCGGGIKPARGWSWINPRPMFEARDCSRQEEDMCCTFCPCGGAVPDRAGLVWIGEKFYPTTEAWLTEARKLGVSRRIPRVPAGFKLGDRVFAAHRKAIVVECVCEGIALPAGDTCPTCEGEGKLYRAAIFHSFTPTRIEYVCEGTETEAELDALLQRGLTPVRVRRDTDLKEPGQNFTTPEAPGADDDDGENP